MNDRNSRRKTCEEAGTLSHGHLPLSALSFPGLLWLGAGLRGAGTSLG